MRTKAEIAAEIAPFYTSHKVIADEAYSIWEKEGRPDGDSPSKLAGIKLKDIHWMIAQWKLEMLWETDTDIFWTVENFGPK